MSITLADAKAHLRYEANDEDTLIESYIASAKGAIERYIGGSMDTDPTAIDELHAAQKLMVGHWFENRESVVTGTIATELPMTVEWLLQPLRLPTLR